MKILAYLLVLIVPIVLIYLGFLFSTWGAYWYPGDWSVETRIAIIILIGVWIFAITGAVVS